MHLVNIWHDLQKINQNSVALEHLLMDMPAM